jgi:hypothetical protein
MTLIRPKRKGAHVRTRTHDGIVVVLPGRWYRGGGTGAVIPGGAHEVGRVGTRGTIEGNRSKGNTRWKRRRAADTRL